MTASRMLLKDLKAHPLQPQYFADTAPDEDRTLAADLRQHGQLSPIVVMPPDNAAGLPGGTILDGHRRARFMAENGETHAEVLVRDDLKEASEERVELEYLKFNVLRRQLGPLTKARHGMRIFELERHRNVRLERSGSEADARDRVGEILRVSGRHLQRYWNVLKTPLEVQDAVERRLLSVVMAEKVVQLSRSAQAELAAKLKALADPRQAGRVVREWLPRQFAAGDRRAEKTAIAATRRMLRAIARDLPYIVVKQLEGPDIVPFVPTIRRTCKMMKQLLRASRKKPRSDRMTSAELREILSGGKS